MIKCSSSERLPRIGVISPNEAWGGSELLWTAMVEEALLVGHPCFIAIQPWTPMPEQVQRLQEFEAQIFVAPRSSGRLSVGNVLRHRIYRYLSRSAKPVQNLVGHYERLVRMQCDVLCVSLGWDGHLIHAPQLPEFLDRTTIPYTLVVQYVDNHTLSMNDQERRTAVRLLSKARCVAFVAEQNLIDTERHIGASLKNAVVVRNPLNMGNVSPVPWPDDETFSLGNVARLSIKAKGQDVLLETLAQPKWRNRSWRLNFYGSGADAVYLKSLSEHYGLTQRVLFHGHVEDIRKIWAENHLAVMPSRGEGTPLSLVEAMICGRAAVVTDVGGNAEWIRDGQNGFLAAAPTSRWLDQALEHAWQRRTDWKQFGQAARRTALEQYDPRPGRTLLDLTLGKNSAMVRSAA